MSKKSNTILKWACLLLLAAYSTWITVWAHDEASRHVCRNIVVNVEAPHPVDSIVRTGVYDEIKKFPGKIIGTPLNQIDTRAVERYLNSLSTFETVNCMVTGSGDLRISVVPMVPVMRVFVGDKSFYINKDGKYIASNAEFFSDVPIVSGDFNRKFQPVDVLPLVNFITGDATMGALTAMIHAEGPRNLIIIPRIRGHVVNFGDTSRLEQKRDALTAFYRKVMPYKGWNEYDTISVKFRGQIVATRRDKTRLNVAEEPVEEVDLEEATLPDAPLTAETAATDTTKHKTNNKPEAPSHE